MNSVSIRYLKSHLSAVLSSLEAPITVTKRGKTIAIISHPDKTEPSQVVTTTEKPTDKGNNVVTTAKDNVVTIDNVTTTVGRISKAKGSNICEHGFPKGLCKQGCK